MIYPKNWQQQSLEELEQQEWGDPSTAPTPLVKRCIELSKVSIDSFSVSDLRLMIGQKFGLLFLVPIAIEKLQKDIFIEADYYEGDLLAAVLAINSEFWKENQNCWKQINELISSKREELKEKRVSVTLFDSAEI